MNKLLIISLTAIFVACKSSAPVVNSSIDRRAQVAIKGDWTISAVTFEGSNMFKLNSFDIADSKCFEGSTWKFISNNDSGNMSLNQPNCPSFSSAIKWFSNKDGQMVLKFISEGVKAKKAKEGYILTLKDQTMESFKLVDRVNIGGKMTDVIYSFRKSN